jgi:hypothetical protein
MATCRLCGNSDEPLFKYSTRHYAHARCAFAKWGEKFFDMIPQHMIGNLPAMALMDAGLYKEAERRMRVGK